MGVITKRSLQTLLSGLDISRSVNEQLFNLIIESDMTNDQATKLVDMLEPLIFNINEDAKDSVEAGLEEVRNKAREIEDDRDILEQDLARSEDDLEEAISYLEEIRSIASEQIDTLEPYKIKVAVKSMEAFRKIQKKANNGAGIKR